MTTAEVIRTLKRLAPNPYDFLARKAVEEAIKALEKQVPKKPLPASDIDKEYLFGNEAVCQNCRHMVATYNGNFCPNCGQLIDWEEQE